MQRPDRCRDHERRQRAGAVQKPTQASGGRVKSSAPLPDAEPPGAPSWSARPERNEDAQAGQRLPRLESNAPRPAAPTRSHGRAVPSFSFRPGRPRRLSRDGKEGMLGISAARSIWMNEDLPNSPSSTAARRPQVVGAAVDRHRHLHVGAGRQRGQRDPAGHPQRTQAATWQRSSGRSPSTCWPPACCCSRSAAWETFAGIRPVYVSGFGVFIVGSALCGLSPSAGALTAFRAIQAIGAAMIFASSPALLTMSFPASQRGQRSDCRPR